MSKPLSLFILLGIVFGLGIAVQIYPIRAQENTDVIAQKYHITFPVAALGNCGSLMACKAYCDDSSNQAACVTFAKEKGFYKEPAQANMPVLQAAKTARSPT